MKKMKELIRVGIVSSINPAKCAARVAFGDKSNLVSYELPVLVRGSLQTKDYWMPAPGEQVVCLFLPTGNAQGFIVGSPYSEKDQPPVTVQNKRHIVFPDDTKVEYDWDTHTFKVDAKGPIKIIVAGQVELTATSVAINGDVTVVGDVTADGVSLKTHTHSGVTSGPDNSGPPVGGA